MNLYKATIEERFSLTEETEIRWLSIRPILLNRKRFFSIAMKWFRISIS